jgi:hypothetical protein
MVEIDGKEVHLGYFDTVAETVAARNEAETKEAERKARNADNDIFLEKVTKKFREDRHKAMTDLPDGTGFDSCRGWYARHKIDGDGYFFGYYTTWDEAIAVVRAVGLIPDRDDPITESRTHIVGDVNLERGKP